MHPEHFDLSSSPFLPVAAETCLSLLGANGVKILTDLTDPELAAILVIQNLAGEAEEQLTSHWVESVLAKLIAWAVDARKSEAPGLLSEAQRLFEPDKFYSGCRVAKRLNLRFLLPDEVSARDYLLPNGKWDVAFKARHCRNKSPFSEQVVTPWHRERWLTPAQDKLIRTFRANLDEHLHIQGYAGIGKSHLLGALREYLRPENTLVLAHTEGKLEALRRRMGGAHAKETGFTFMRFAQSLLPGYRPQSGSAPARNPSKLALSQELSILGLSGYDKLATLNICLKVIERYCQSRDVLLSAKHLPKFQVPLSNLDARVLLQYSSRLWMYVEANPTLDKLVGLETLLPIKRASLAGCVVPARYSHVLIDESQDLPESLLQIIERGRQVLITLGDEYQQAGGAMVNRKREVRRSDISYSVRSGRNVESLVNPLIYRHSKKGKIPFEGASEDDVVIKYYPQDFLPSDGCVVLTASYWDTMRWIIQMNAVERPLSLWNANALMDFKQFMATAIALFKPDFYSVDQISGGPHLYFSEMSNWQQVREANKYDGAFLWVEAELEKGFNIADMNQLKWMLSQQGKSCTVMMAREAGGMEFDRVFLTPELLTNEKFKNSDEFDEQICAVYIAISRAKRKLYLPCDVIEWIELHNRQQFREPSGY